MPVRGACNCGAVEVELARMPESSVFCHCLSCRKSGGGIGSLNLLVERADFDVRGEVRQFTAQGTSGRDVVRNLCGNCGSPVFTTATVVGETPVYLKGGLFPCGSLPKPGKELFTRNLESWEEVRPGAEGAETQ